MNFKLPFLLTVLISLISWNVFSAEPNIQDSVPDIGTSYDSIREVRNDYHVECPRPKYPPSSLRNGEQGATELKVDVDINGKVTSAQVMTSSKYSHLDQASIKVYEKCIFQPKTSEYKRPFSVVTKVDWHVVR